MISDIRTYEDRTKFQADICIIGCGAASIAMARILAGSSLKILILESGGASVERATQGLYAGTTSGLSYFDLDESRYRMIGGSTHRWGARAARFKETDFAERCWLDFDGWPIKREDLKPYYAEVPEFLNVHKSFEDERIPWELFSVSPPKINADDLEFSDFQFGKKLLLGNVYADMLKTAPNIEVLTHATVTRIAANDAGNHISQLDVQTLNGMKFTVTANTYVLACGGIENARLLLLSDDVIPAGLCNSKDHVGRYFMEHPTASAGIVHASKPQALHDIFSPGLIGGRLVETALAPTAAMMEREGILNVCAITRLNVAEDATQALREIIWNMRHRKVPLSLSWYRTNRWLKERLTAIARNPFSIVGNLVRHMMGRPKRFKIESMQLELRSEQAPNPDSRVTLGTETDAFGQRRAHLHWDLLELDWHTMVVMAETVDKELQRLGLGKLETADWLKGTEPRWPNDLVGGHHHMGQRG